MKEMFFHFSVIMSFLTLLIGLWTNYDYSNLIIKAVEVFFICMVGSSIVQYALKYVLPEPPEEEPAPEKVEEKKENTSEQKVKNVNEPQPVNFESEANKSEN
jgi:hypothetical protein